MKYRIFSLIFALVLILSFAGCGNGDNAVSSAAVSVAETERTEIGEGSISFPFEVVVKDQTTAFLVHTEQTSVGKALQEVGLIAGDQNEYGLYVKTVNGITADYDTDHAYWAFFIDGSYADKGVDQIEIEAGKTYRFTYTES